MLRIALLSLTACLLSACLGIGLDVGGGSSSGVDAGIGVSKEVDQDDPEQGKDEKTATQNEPPGEPVDDKPPGFD